MVTGAREASNRNDFLASLGPSEFEWMLPHLAPCDLRRGKSLYRCDDDINEVIFPYSGLVALTMPSREQSGVLVLLVGLDGIVGGLSAAAETPATCDADVLIGGEAWRMSASTFRRALDEQPGIRRVAARFDSSALAQAQQPALCNAIHRVEAHICRWLLEIYDRCDSNGVPLEHDSPFREQVAKALVSSGHAYAELGRVREVISITDDIIKRYGDATEPELREAVSNAAETKKRLTRS